MEVRVADVQLTLDEALFVAATIRAAAHHVLELVREGGASGAEVSDELLRAAVWQAARDEFGAALLDPVTGRSRPTAEVMATAEATLAPALATYGDADRVERARRRREDTGSGAARPRRRFTEAGPAGLLELLVDDFLH